MEWVELEWVDTGDLGPDRPDYVAWHGDQKVARVYVDKVAVATFSGAGPYSGTRCANLATPTAAEYDQM